MGRKPLLFAGGAVAVRNAVLLGDEVLVRGVLEDRPRDFEKLVLRHRRKAYAFAEAMGVPPRFLEDIVQDSFLQAFECLPNLRQQENFGLWFLNIVRTTSRRFMRKRRSHQALECIPHDGDPGDEPEGVDLLEYT